MELNTNDSISKSPISTLIREFDRSKALKLLSEDYVVDWDSFVGESMSGNVEVSNLKQIDKKIFTVGYDMKTLRQQYELLVDEIVYRNQSLKNMYQQHDQLLALHEQFQNYLQLNQKLSSAHIVKFLEERDSLNQYESYLHDQLHTSQENHKMLSQFHENLQKKQIYLTSQWTKQTENKHLLNELLESNSKKQEELDKMLSNLKSNDRYILELKDEFSQFQSNERADDFFEDSKKLTFKRCIFRTLYFHCLHRKQVMLKLQHSYDLVNTKSNLLRKLKCLMKWKLALSLSYLHQEAYQRRQNEKLSRVWTYWLLNVSLLKLFKNVKSRRYLRLLFDGWKRFIQLQHREYQNARKIDFFKQKKLISKIFCRWRRFSLDLSFLFTHGKYLHSKQEMKPWMLISLSRCHYVKKMFHRMKQNIRSFQKLNREKFLLIQRNMTSYYFYLWRNIYQSICLHRSYLRRKFLKKLMQLKEMKTISLRSLVDFHPNRLVMKRFLDKLYQRRKYLKIRLYNRNIGSDFINRMVKRIHFLQRNHLLMTLASKHWLQRQLRRVIFKLIMSSKSKRSNKLSSHQCRHLIISRFMSQWIAWNVNHQHIQRIVSQIKYKFQLRLFRITWKQWTSRLLRETKWKYQEYLIDSQRDTLLQQLQLQQVEDLNNDLMNVKNEFQLLNDESTQLSKTHYQNKIQISSLELCRLELLEEQQSIHQSIQEEKNRLQGFNSTRQNQKHFEDLLLSSKEQHDKLKTRRKHSLLSQIDYLKNEVTQKEKQYHQLESYCLSLRESCQSIDEGISSSTMSIIRNSNTLSSTRSKDLNSFKLESESLKLETQQSDLLYKQRVLEKEWKGLLVMEQDVISSSKKQSNEFDSKIRSNMAKVRVLSSNAHIGFARVKALQELVETEYQQLISRQDQEILRNEAFEIEQLRQVLLSLES